MTGWIPTKEMLPDFDKPVLVISGCHPDSIYSAMRVWEDEGWCWYQHSFGPIGDPSCYECDDEYNYTHWMPLPEPPKEGSSND